MSKVSVIVPVYNVEKFLVECLESIVNQTFSDIEIICVNDASPDNSRTILEDYARRFNNIKIFTHDKNEGLGAARNTGLRHTSSKYVAFVDSDDTIEPTFIESLVNLAEENCSDLSWCGNNTIDENSNFIVSHMIPDGNWSVIDILNKEELYPSILPVWNKLFKFEYLKNIKQLPIVSEDQPALAEYFARCNLISTTSQNLYNYRTNFNTLSRPIIPKATFWNDFFYSHELFFKILRIYYPKNEQLRKQAILRHFSLLWRIKNFNMLLLENWSEHEQVIKNHIKQDKIGLKRFSQLMYFYLWMIFNFNWGTRIKKYLINTGIVLSKNRWLNNANFLFFLVDILKLSFLQFKALLRKICDFIELSVLKLISLVLRNCKTKDVWLISERPDTAQENGIYFFDFLQNIRKHQVYYIIDKRFEHHSSMEKYHEAVIHYNSLKHKILFLRCKYYVSSHYNNCFPLTYFGNKLYPKSLFTFNVFLQHGITYADVSPYYGKQKSSINLFICGAKPEYDYILEKFGYSSKEVTLTGFARFDGLHNCSPQKTILYMPTWRRNLDRLTPDDFKRTSYYKRIISLLNNQDLLNLVYEAGYDLVFFPHYQLLKFLHLFKVDARIIIPENGASVQKLLINSAILITDVSSVHFDFAYMYKPIIYYIWDYENVVGYHLAKGYYNHNEMGFGPVLENENEIIIQLRKIIDNGCTLETIYKKRIDDFFPLHDKRNCERIYKTIIKFQS